MNRVKLTNEKLKGISNLQPVRLNRRYFHSYEARMKISNHRNREKKYSAIDGNNKSIQSINKCMPNNDQLSRNDSNAFNEELINTNMEIEDKYDQGYDTVYIFPRRKQTLIVNNTSYNNSFELHNLINNEENLLENSINKYKEARSRTSELYNQHNLNRNKSMNPFIRINEVNAKKINSILGFKFKLNCKKIVLYITRFESTFNPERINMDIKPQIFTIDLKNRFNLETNKSVKDKETDTKIDQREEESEHDSEISAVVNEKISELQVTLDTLRQNKNTLESKILGLEKELNLYKEENKELRLWSLNLFNGQNTDNQNNKCSECTRTVLENK